MAVSSASRFAVLHVEDYDSDDCDDSANKNSKNSTASNNNNKKGKTATTTATQNKTTKKPKKKNQNNESAELQNLIFGTGKAKSKGNNSNQNASSKGPAKGAQWQEWYEKDQKFVSETYEQDLQQALLLSKVQYEENKEMMHMIKVQQNLRLSGVGGETEVEEGTKKTKKKSGSASKKEKGQGSTTMSLGQFNNLLPSQIDAGVHNLVANGTVRPAENGVPEKPPAPVLETDFFDKIEEDAEKIIRSEQRRDNFKKNEPFIAEQALSLELRDELEKKDRIIEELTSANTKLKEELKSVKYRNKKLCNILAQGEMKDKAEILVQAEKLRNLRDELTEEVSSLHAALEQEKSKVHLLQTELKKQQSGKKDQKKEASS